MIINKYTSDGDYETIFSSSSVDKCLIEFNTLLQEAEKNGNMIVKEINKSPILYAAWFATEKDGFVYSIAAIDVLAAMKEIGDIDFNHLIV